MHVCGLVGVCNVRIYLLQLVGTSLQLTHSCHHTTSSRYVYMFYIECMCFSQLCIYMHYIVRICVCLSQLVETYLQQTHAITHNQYKMKLLEVFDVEKQGEAAKFLDHGNRQVRVLRQNGWSLCSLSEWVEPVYPVRMDGAGVLCQNGWVGMLCQIGWGRCTLSEWMGRLLCQNGWGRCVLSNWMESLYYV